MLGLGIILVYFLTRFYHLLTLPIFTDEAIYIRWAQIALQDASWRFISLTDGKQPLYVWLVMVLLRVFKDPLFAGRIVSVGAGFLTLTGLFFLTNEIFQNKKIALLASLFYVIYPFTLVYDKLALYDSLVGTFIIWSLYFEFLLIKHIRLDISMILGMIIGLGMLTKSSADFALILLPLSVVLFPFKEKKAKVYFGKWVGFCLVTAFIAFAMYSVLRLSPFYYIIGLKDDSFIYPFSVWIHQPFAFLLGNLSGLLSWFVGYTSIPFIILILLSFLISKKYIREKLLLGCWFIVPFIALAFFGKVIYPRFILFMTLPLLPLASISLFALFEKLPSKVKGAGIIKVFIFMAFTIMILVTDYFLLFNFPQAPIPQADRGQLITSWPSGVGVSQTVSYLEEKGSIGKIYVGTEGTFGLMPYSLQIFLKSYPNITIEGYWPIQSTIPPQVLKISKQIPTYFVFYQPCPPCAGTGVAPAGWPVKPVFQIQKLEKGSYYTLYEVQK